MATVVVGPGEMTTSLQGELPETELRARAPASGAQDDDDEEFFDGNEGDDNDNWDEEDFDLCETMDDTPNKIQDGLFISGFLAEQNKVKLQKAGITHVLQVAEGLGSSHPDEFKYLQISVQDAPGEDLGAHFHKAFEFISAAAEQKGGVLVHCVAGVSRSATICIAYLMWQHKISYDDAFRRVHAVRPWIMPNAGFRKQLQLFQEQGCDPSAWRAWRHSHKEDPSMVVSLANLGITAPSSGTHRAKHDEDESPVSFDDL